MQVRGQSIDPGRRAGSDIACVGGLIRHINEDFRDSEELGACGYFSGFDPETGTYDRDSWRYEGEQSAAQAG